MAPALTPTAPTAPEPTREEAVRCGNCGARLAGPYCAACGQRQARPIRFGAVLRDAFRAVASLDSRFARTVVGLGVRPGKTVQAFLGGQRIRYVNPLKYVFFCTTLYVVLAAVFDAPFYRPEDWQQGPGGETFAFVMRLVPYLVFLELLPSAWVQQRLFRRAGLTVAECYVAQLYVYGQAVLYVLPLALLGVGATAAGLVVIRLAGLPVLAWTLVQLYRTPVVPTFLKAVLLHALYLAVSIVVSVAAAMAFVFITYLL